MREKTLIIADEIVNVIKDYCARAVGSLAEEFVELRKRIDSLPKPEKGEKGDPGTPGAAGKDGAPGKDGHDGKDADTAAVIAEVLSVAEKHLSELVAALPAPVNGKDGRDGVDGKSVEGPQGLPGAAGQDGKSVDVAEVHRLIGDLVAKAVGSMAAPKDGRDGKDGVPGEHGRDAAQLDPLVGIDPSKSYRRGTWALYRGGTIVATRQTDPFTEESITERTLAESGWAIALEGVCDENEEYLDEGRRIEKVTVFTSGRVKKISRIGRSTFYRGIFKPGAEYLRGDEVTWSGSIWHCMAETTKEHPGNGSPDWVLAVKQGERGKSAPEAGDHKRTTIKLK